MKTFFLRNNCRKALLLVLPVLLFSCSAEDSFRSTDLVEIKKGAFGSFRNTTITEYNRQVKLSSFFNLNQSDSIVEINSQKNKLIVGYIDFLGAKHYQAYEGKSRSKFFQFYLRYDTVLVPPLFIRIEKEQIRLSIDKDSNLVVNRYQDNSGMLFFFGAGHSGNSKYVFTKNN